MANQNSFRELGDQFNVAQSRDVVIQVLTAICNMAPADIKLPSLCDKHICAGVFARWTHPLLKVYCIIHARLSTAFLYNCVLSCLLVSG